MKKIISIILVVSLCFSVFLSGCTPRQQGETRFHVVTSFYPLYIMALNITKGIENIQVDNMAGQQAGCLHDYQLQSKDIKNLEQADVFVINGGGMESFLTKVTDQLPSLMVINSSEHILLLGEEHDHEGEDHGPEEEVNSHIWVSITNCIAQVRTIAQGLAKADPEYADRYLQNAQDYIAQLSLLRQKMHEELDGLPNRDIITFHEAFPYFAEEFDLNIVKVVNREPDSQPSAKELAETIHLVRDTGVKAVFAEPQYPESAANIIAEESGVQVYLLDPGVTGEDSPDAYMNAMEKNLEVLRNALQ